MARLEHASGIAGSYYFRAVPESWDEKIIQTICSLGHEIGYHYENLSAVSRKKDFRKLKAPQYHLPELPRLNTLKGTRFNRAQRDRRGKEVSVVY